MSEIKHTEQKDQMVVLTDCLPVEKQNEAGEWEYTYKPEIKVRVMEANGVCLALEDEQDEYFLVTENIEGRLAVHIWTTRKSRGQDPTHTIFVELASLGKELTK